MDTTKTENTQVQLVPDETQPAAEPQPSEDAAHTPPEPATIKSDKAMLPSF